MANTGGYARQICHLAISVGVQQLLILGNSQTLVMPVIWQRLKQMLLLLVLILLLVLLMLLLVCLLLMMLLLVLPMVSARQLLVLMVPCSLRFAAFVIGLRSGTAGFWAPLAGTNNEYGIPIAHCPLPFSHSHGLW